MTELEARLLEAIPRGMGDAKPVAQIAEEVGEESSEPTHYQLRQVIKRLVTEHERPIASCSDGYFLITDQHELDEYVADLRQRKRGIQKRISAVQNAFRSDTGPQHSMFS
jgi:hypothetical protein